MEDMDIGGRIQEYRKAAKMSLRELATRAEISASMLSQIENNIVNPSINSLKNIAEALDVPLYKFFKPQEPSAEDQIVRKGKHRIIGHWGTEVTYKLLTPDTESSIEFILMEIPAGTSTTKMPRGHKGEETAYVMEGPVQIMVDEHTYELNEGDSIRILPRHPHQWTNHSRHLVRVIFAVNPPSF